MLTFAGFVLDTRQSRLRNPAGEVVRLRRKSFEMLQFLAANAGRLVTKQELMDAIWPNVHVGDDSLFQCIREIRTALSDERRELVKLVSGRGYLFDMPVTTVVTGNSEPAGLNVTVLPVSDSTPSPADEMQPPALAPPPPARNRWTFDRYRLVTLGLIAVIGAIVGIAVATPLLSTEQPVPSATPTLVVTPINASGIEPDVAAMAARVTEQLTDGLARIERLRVLAPSALQLVAAVPGQGDFLVNGELRKQDRLWMLTTRLVNRTTGEVRWANTVSINEQVVERHELQTRLAAAAGYPLAQRLNAIVNSDIAGRTDAREVSAANAKVVIEQAAAAINQTTPERFRAAQAMLEKALADDPDNADVQVALSVHMLRGIQLVWYDADQKPAIEKKAQAILEHALRSKPSYLPVLEGYCRFLAATNQFIEGIVACGKALAYNRWNGQALYNLGLSQMQLGRFADALASFEQADTYNTPEFSRWTWMLGAGIACLMMDRDEDAAHWLERSIAVTPATGRTHSVLAAAYQRLGRIDEAKAAMAKALQLRPGTTTANIGLPTKNASPTYLEASRRIRQAQVEAGLPEK